MSGRKKMASVSFSTAVDPGSERKESVRISVATSRSSFPLLPTSHHGSYSSTAPSSPGLLPPLFERASKTWWNPKFDSSILEDQYRKSTFTQTRKRFQFALLYLLVNAGATCLYVGLSRSPSWVVFGPVLGFLLVALASLLGFTCTEHFQPYYLPTSLLTVMLLYLCSLLAFLPYTWDPALSLSPLGLFSLALQIILLVYTVIPLPLHFCFVFGLLYSVAFEVLSAFFAPEVSTTLLMSVRALLHLCVHLLSIHILLNAEVQMRITFLKVGQFLMVRRDLEVEKQLKEKIIHCMMPPKVAKSLMDTQESEEESFGGSPDSERKTSASPHQSHVVFRPFNMHCMDNVSILFADIVGFTRMSSNKTADQLVELLNDLFARFDDLCTRLGCEKISTLGDCYYCVSGCPEPRKDHARCCVEMGLGMIKAIGEFDEDTSEDVTMRVGVHTGTVLCGIVGTSRFKFDVLSNDVRFANLMESTGKPGRVHISGSTYDFLEDYYEVEEGPMQKGPHIPPELSDKRRDILAVGTSTGSVFPREQQSLISRLKSGHLQTMTFQNGCKVFPLCTKCNSQLATPKHIIDCIDSSIDELYSSPADTINKFSKLDTLI
ncbi:ADCY9 [Cordylochernes scorpioides]|uniref:adenylate cyclase n=1 Tax=Cordylochernes scorpioides TaxID=51811 RepID=A0ABY6K7R6_9ARAC|nr:ADCY9 [Cordylochernes scorpioides]